MTTYYVRKTGSDAAAGTSPATAWLTIGKALGAAGISSGDTVHFGGGTYREATTVAMVSAVAETFVVGDYTGQYTGDAGGVIWSAYTTNDTTAPSTSPTMTFNGRDYLTFTNITFVGGSSSNAGCVMLDAIASTSTNITFRSCAFNAGNTLTGRCVDVHVLTQINAAILFDRCIFFGFPGSGNGTLKVQLQNGAAGADYDCGVRATSCLFYGNAVNVGIDGAGNTYQGGGVDLLHSTVIGGNAYVVGVSSANVSDTVSGTVYNCFLAGSGLGTAALVATTSGQIVENYNWIGAGTARSNVNIGANSISNGSVAPLLEFGQAALEGRAHRMPMEPAAGSPLLTFANDTTIPATDLLGRPRPSGGGIAGSFGIGALARGNTFTKNTGTVRTGTNSIACTGPAVQDFIVPVAAAATTITCYVQWDATYAGTKPRMSVLNGGSAGVTDATATATGASGSWEQLSLSFTPTSIGYVTIRLQSSDTNGGGAMFVDDFAATQLDITSFDHFRLGEPLPLMMTTAAGTANGGGSGGDYSSFASDLAS